LVFKKVTTEEEKDDKNKNHFGNISFVLGKGTTEEEKNEKNEGFPRPGGDFVAPGNKLNSPRSPLPGTPS
jgi:hypothetical protein